MFFNVFLAACLPVLTEPARASQTAEIANAVAAACGFLLGESGDYRSARVATEEASRRYPRNPLTFYLFGMVLLRGPDVVVSATSGHLLRAGYFLSNAEIEARRAFQRALSIDPDVAPAASALAELALLIPTETNLAAADDALSRLHTRAATNVELWLEHSDVSWLRGDRANAIKAGRQAYALAPSASAAHALASALLMDPRTQDEGAQLYMNGLGILDSVAEPRFIDDVRPVLNVNERTALAGRTTTSDVRTWLTAYWERHAAFAGLSVAERLAEQKLREIAAHQHYRRTAFRGGRAGVAQQQRTVMELRRSAAADSLPFDDRGLLLLHLGFPDTIVSSTPARPESGRLAVPANESWVYSGGGPGNVYNFYRIEGSGDFVAAGMPECLPPEVNSSTLGSIHFNSQVWISPFTSLLESRLPFDSTIGTQLAECLAAMADLQRQMSPRDDQPRVTVDWKRFSEVERLSRSYRDEAQRYYDAAMSRVVVDPPFTSKAPMHVSAYAFRGSGSATELVAALLAPAALLKPDSTEHGFVYSIDLSLMAIDSSGVVVRRDTTQQFASPRRLRDGEFLRTQLSVAAVTPGINDVRVILRNKKDRSSGSGRSVTRVIPDLNGTALAISDIVLAEDTVGAFRRAQTSLSLRPTHQFAPQNDIVLYYEIYGLQPNERYRTSIELVQEPGTVQKLVGKSGKPRFDVAFEDQTQVGARVVQQTRVLKSELQPAVYRVRVSVVTSAGQTAERVTTLRITAENDRR